MNKHLLATCRIATSALALLVGLSMAQAAQIYVTVAPPAPQVEVMPPPPPGQPMEWRPGYWRWNGAQYVWIPGHYMHPPRMGAHWVPGHWAQSPQGWVWMRGHWA
jgi:hypothetical protein